MKRNTLYKISLALGISIVFIGALFKIMHYPGAGSILIVGTVISFIFIIIALEKIFINKKNSPFDKLLWLIAFIFLSWIAGIVYYFNEIKSKT